MFGTTGIMDQLSHHVKSLFHIIFLCSDLSQSGQILANENGTEKSLSAPTESGNVCTKKPSISSFFKNSFLIKAMLWGILLI